MQVTDNKGLKPAIFADRDGTLIEEVNYLSRVADLRLFPSTSGAVAELKASGFLFVVVTNQSGIGRGIYTEADMHTVHNELQELLDGAVDGFYFCPHLPCDGCECRKPGTKMFEDAARELGIDLSRSWMIGDKDIDVKAGSNAGASTILVSTGYGKLHKPTLETENIRFAVDFGAAISFILDQNS